MVVAVLHTAQSMFQWRVVLQDSPEHYSEDLVSHALQVAMAEAQRHTWRSLPSQVSSHSVTSQVFLHSPSSQACRCYPFSPAWTLENSLAAQARVMSAAPALRILDVAIHYPPHPMTLSRHPRHWHEALVPPGKDNVLSSRMATHCGHRTCRPLSPQVQPSKVQPSKVEACSPRMPRSHPGLWSVCPLYVSNVLCGQLAV